MTTDDSVVPFLDDSFLPGLPLEVRLRFAKVHVMGKPIVSRAIDEMRELGLSDNEISGVLETAANELYVPPRYPWTDDTSA